MLVAMVLPDRGEEAVADVVEHLEQKAKKTRQILTADLIRAFDSQAFACPPRWLLSQHMSSYKQHNRTLCSRCQAICEHEFLFFVTYHQIRRALAAIPAGAGDRPAFAI